MSTKVYIGNLDWNTTDDILRTLFSPYGQVLDSKVMRDVATGTSRGFGFVTFATKDEAQNAIASLNEQELDGHCVKVSLANASGTGGTGEPISDPYGLKGYGGSRGFGGGQQVGFGGGYGGQQGGY